MVSEHGLSRLKPLDASAFDFQKFGNIVLLICITFSVGLLVIGSFLYCLKQID
jgi:hypothetical protein